MTCGRVSHVMVLWALDDGWGLDLRVLDPGAAKRYCLLLTLLCTFSKLPHRLILILRRMSILMLLLRTN